MGKIYQELLKNIPAQLPVEKTNYAQNNYWVFGIVLNKNVKFNAKEAMKTLNEKGIGTRPFFYPMHLQPALKKIGLSDNIARPISENLYERGLYIPSGLALSDEQIEFVANKVRELF